MDKKLVLVKNDERFPLKEITTVGRGIDCDLTIPLTSVSTQHATITCLEGMYTIKDNNSTNGTFINHRKLNTLQEYPLKEGYIVRFGTESFEAVAVTEDSMQIDPRYKIIQERKQGKFLLFYAQVKETCELVLIKALNQKLADDDVISMFHRECRLMRKLKNFIHPNIVRIHHVEIPSTAADVYLVIEHIQGESIAKCVDKGFVSEAFAIDIALQIAKATSTLHKKFDIIHRDICPDNILLTSRLIPKISNLSSSKGTTSITLTIDMDQNNSNFYMAPEIILEEKKHSAQSDIYSLGLTLYYMLKKKLPFSSLEEVVSFANSGQPVPKLENTEIGNLLSQMIAHNYKDRFASYETLVEALEKLKKVLGADQTIAEFQKQMTQEEQFDKGKTLQTTRLGAITKNLLKQRDLKKTKPE